MEVSSSAPSSSFSSRFVTAEQVLHYRPPTHEEVGKIIEKNRKLLHVIYRCLTAADARLDVVDMVINSCRKALHRNLIYLSTHLHPGDDKNWCLQLLRDTKPLPLLPPPAQGTVANGVTNDVKCNQQNAPSSSASWCRLTNSGKEPEPACGGQSDLNRTLDDAKREVCEDIDMDTMGTYHEENLLWEFVYAVRFCKSPIFSVRLDLGNQSLDHHEDLGSQKHANNAAAQPIAHIQADSVPRAVLMEMPAGSTSYASVSKPQPDFSHIFPSELSTQPNSLESQVLSDSDVHRHLCFCSTSLKDLDLIQIEL